MTDLQVFRAAKQKIATRGKWCRDGMAVTSSGIHVLSTDPRAVRFCARGALEAATGGGGCSGMIRRYTGFLPPPWSSLIAMNDHSAREGGGFKAVHKFFDRVIRHLEGKARKVVRK